MIRLWLWLFYRKGWLIGPFVRGRNMSKGLPWRPDKTAQGWKIEGGEPHYVTRDCDGLSGSIRLRYRASGWVAVEGGAPGVSLHFQRKGDDWSASGRYSMYRWYSREMFPLEGEHEVTMPLTVENWRAVFAAIHIPSFEAAKSNASRVGLCFGAAQVRGHGVRGGVFELLDFEVLP